VSARQSGARTTTRCADPIIVASSPGTASDVFARSIGEDLGAFYRQHILIDNRTGAGGLIGNMLVSKANADGYTLGMVDVTRIITELMRDQPPYRALADVVGVAHVASITNVLAVSRSLPRAHGARVRRLRA
jgi:tripartite-type tricarboxylate transporter receptor subunit TctC